MLPLFFQAFSAVIDDFYLTFFTRFLAGENQERMARVEGFEPPTGGFGDRCSDPVELHSQSPDRRWLILMLLFPVLVEK
jgi:hypothetical protein